MIERFERLNAGQILKISCQCRRGRGRTKWVYVKMDREGGGIVWHEKDGDTWWAKADDDHPEICAALLDPLRCCSVAGTDGYAYSTSEALDAVYTKGATITSECCEYENKRPEWYCYHLDSDGYLQTADRDSASISKEEYLGRWKIEYPKGEKEC